MRGYVLDMEPVIEHRVQLAGHAHARARGGRRRPRHRAPARLERLGRHLAPAAGRARRAAAGARSRSTCPASARRRRLHAGAVLPQLDAFAAELVERWAGERAGRRRGHVARRLPRAAAGRDTRASCGSPASSRSRPTGSRCRRGSTRSRRTRSSAGCSRSRSPCPGELVRRAQRERLPPARASAPERDAAAVVDAFSRDGETRADVAALLESGRELAPELSTAPFDLVGIRCPVLLVWGAHDRMLPHTDARMALDSLPDHPGRADRGRRPPPAARGHRPPARAAAPFRHVTRNSLARRARGYASCDHAPDRLLADPRARSSPSSPRRGAAEPRIAAGVSRRRASTSRA